MAGYSRIAKFHGNIVVMTVSSDGNPAMHFGKQMRKERTARGWSLREFSQHTGLNPGHVSRIENGKRPPTENVATACDAAFPERRGWFTEYYEESRHWAEVPASFRSWPEYEDKAATLRDWSPSVVTGLLQSQDYARALIAVQASVTDDVVTARLTARMERQRRVLGKDDPPTACFIVDELSLYREVGSTEVMAGQLRHLSAVAARPQMIVQILPAVAHTANASGFLLADDAVWVEHVAAGYVFTDTETVAALAMRFDSLRGECYRVSESLRMIERLGERWASGVSLLTATATAGTA